MLPLNIHMKSYIWSWVTKKGQIQGVHLEKNQSSPYVTIKH